MPLASVTKSGSQRLNLVPGNSHGGTLVESENHQAWRAQNRDNCRFPDPPENMRPLGIEPDSNAAKTPENPQKTNSVAPKVAPSSDADPDFAIVAEFWTQLPAAIKAGIVAMVRTAMRIGYQS